MSLGLFPVITMVAWIPFLPTVFWDWMGGYILPIQSDYCAFLKEFREESGFAGRLTALFFDEYLAIND